MNTILRLYPRAWRDRYGDELAALLEEQPTTLSDTFDLIRGAIDARLHPQIPGSNTLPDKEIPVNSRLLGVLAAIGGIAWLIAVASIFILPRNADGDRDTSLAIIGLAIAIPLTGIALGELGSRRGSTASGMTGHVIGVISLVFGALVLLPWPWFIVPIYGFPVLGVVAALRGTQNGVMPTWLAGVFAFAAVGTIAGSLGSIDNEIGLALLCSTGLAALVLAWAAISGRGTSPAEVSPA